MIHSERCTSQAKMSRKDCDIVLPDLSKVSLDDLRHCTDVLLDESTIVMYAQVERPRYNLGSGPPGRAD